MALVGTINASNDFGFKNRIINGTMAIDQRNGGASTTPTADATYTLDRWLSRLSASSKYSVQLNAGSVTPPVGFTKYLGITSLSAYTVGASDYFLQEHRIEGFNVADLGWGAAGAATVTLSFWVRSSLTGTFGGAIQNGTASRSYPFTYTISSANTWTSISVTVAGDTSGTWSTDTTRSITILFNLGTGSTYSGTAGAWAGTNYVSATSATSVVGTNGATFYITGVQLEKGSTATSFDYRPYSTELALCQRYYEDGYYSARLNGTIIRQPWPFVVQKRTSPTVNVYYDSTKPTAGTINKSNTTDSGWNPSGNIWMANMEKNTGTQQNGTDYGWYWTAGAEL